MQTPPQGGVCFGPQKISVRVYSQAANCHAMKRQPF